MSAIVDMQIACDDEDQPPSEKIRQWVDSALTHCAQQPSALPLSDRAELTIRIVDEAEIRDLNHTYRGKDKTTNVLSFPADVPDHIDLPLLGDIIVCAAVVNREAVEQQKVPEHHWAHMIVHGCLHLVGFDHIDDEDAAEMEALETEILATFGIADPYTDFDTDADNERLRTQQLTKNTVHL